MAGVYEPKFKVGNSSIPRAALRDLSGEIEPAAVNSEIGVGTQLIHLAFFFGIDTDAIQDRAKLFGVSRRALRGEVQAVRTPASLRVSLGMLS